MGLVGQVRSARRAGTMVALTGAMLPAAQAHSACYRDPLRKRDAFRAWERVWAEQLLKTFGMRISALGQPPAGPPRARLVVANHRSPVDILIAVSRIGGCVLSRSDLAQWPLLGAAARAAGTIFVDRENRRSGALAIRAIRNRLRSGDHVVVFPEGATFGGDVVQPFLGGAFAAAKGMEVDVLPVGLAYPHGGEFVDESFAEHMLRVARRPITDVGMAIGEPFAARGSRDAVAAQAQQRVQALVHQARAIVGRRGRPNPAR